MATSKPSSRSSRLIASARQQPELALRCQLQLPLGARELFTAAVSQPRTAPSVSALPEPGPGVKKCRPVPKNAMSAQLQWFALSVNRTR